MGGARTLLSWYLFSIVLLKIGLCATYEIPDAKIEILQPKGFRASIPNSANMTAFAFNGNINNPIGQNDIGAITGEVLSATNDTWVFEDRNVKLQNGDEIRYYIFVSVDGIGYVKDGLVYVVGGGPPKDTVTTPPPPVKDPVEKQCDLSLTTVRGVRRCKGEVVFLDNFEETLDESNWLVEHRFPEDGLQKPFNSYQRDTVSVENGHLRIQPLLQQEMKGFNSDSQELDLSESCTGTSSKYCYMRTNAYEIIPPVASGLVKSRFAFTYGRVDVRAKLPQGDWLYAEILMEPLFKRYGPTGSSVLKLAKVRGNKDVDYGNNILEHGIWLSICPQAIKRREDAENLRLWGDDYHIFSVVWTPVDIKFELDGAEKYTLPLQNLGQLARQKGCKVPQSFSAESAPFHNEFVLSFGVAAGGVTEFTELSPPWNNKSPKATLQFRNAMNKWINTWNVTSALLLDYVKVTAL